MGIWVKGFDAVLEIVGGFFFCREAPAENVTRLGFGGYAFHVFDSDSSRAEQKNHIRIATVTVGALRPCRWRMSLTWPQRVYYNLHLPFSIRR